jgi:hypothetical protein
LQQQTRSDEIQDGPSIVALVADLGETTLYLLRDEFALARREITDAASRIGRLLALLLTGALVAVVALFTLAHAATGMLSRHMGEPEAALVVGLALMIAAGVGVWTGIRRLG